MGQLVEIENRRLNIFFFSFVAMEMMFNDKDIYHNREYYPIDEIDRQFQLVEPLLNNVSFFICAQC